MSVPFIDLTRISADRQKALEDAALRVIRHKQFILGKEVQAFEAAASAHLGGAEVIGVSSGTDALLAGLMALGVRPGDRVLTTPFSFFATAGVIRRLSAVPEFVDIELDHYGIDCEALKVFDPRAYKAVIPVHLFGHTLDLDPLLAWAGDACPILEDAAQAIGSRDAKGRIAGTLGAIGTWSFFPTKNLGAMGDAGLIATGDEQLAERLRCLRVHGQAEQYRHVLVGGNFRLDALQAAGLTLGLSWLDEDTAARRAHAARYSAALTDLAEKGRLHLPVADEHHTFHQYVVRVPGGRRDAVLQGLKAKGIGAMVYYPLPFHLQPCFADLGYRVGAFPRAEQAASEVLALPIYPGLLPTEQAQVIEGLRSLL